MTSLEAEWNIGQVRKAGVHPSCLPVTLHANPIQQKLGCFAPGQTQDLVATTVQMHERHLDANEENRWALPPEEGMQMPKDLMTGFAAHAVP